MSPRCLLGTRLLSLSCGLNTNVYASSTMRLKVPVGKGRWFVSSFKGGVINIRRSVKSCIVRARCLYCQEGKMRPNPSELFQQV